MKKAVFNKSGMKQIIDSGWREFDRQTNCITTGNAYCNTQYSSFIRPWSETECNGLKHPGGHLLDFDLKQFSEFTIPESIEVILRDKLREDSVILYMFSVYKERIEPFCWVVTTRDHKLIRYEVVCGYKQNYTKRHNAALEAIEYITD